MKILTIVGARPQFVKAAVVSRAIKLHNEAGGVPIQEEILHTGQHYDENMSQVFFEELGLPTPAVNLDVRSSRQGEMTGRMLAGIENELLLRSPDWVLVYGDTNSTLAGALAAAKLHMPVAHVEAGLRSFNRRMPEETNRVVTDHVASLLLCPTRNAVAQLHAEGIRHGVHHVGDVMFDVAQLFGQVALERSQLLQRLSLRPKGYYLATFHRAENTDNPKNILAILGALAQLATSSTPVLFPVHPRTRNILRQHADAASATSACAQPHLFMVDPLSFMDMVCAEKNARVILTDSGGVQKEAYFHGVPCVTVRGETEWGETVSSGWNQLVPPESNAILASVACAKTGGPIIDYGSGNAAHQVVRLLVQSHTMVATSSANR